MSICQKGLNCLGFLPMVAYVEVHDVYLQIRCHQDQDSQPVLELVAIATCIPMYGVKDLQEILELMLREGATTVYQSRPLKVTFYLQVSVCVL